MLVLPGEFISSWPFVSFGCDLAVDSQDGKPAQGPRHALPIASAQDSASDTQPRPADSRSPARRVKPKTAEPIDGDQRGREQPGFAEPLNHIEEDRGQKNAK